jgi:hypothetical protein
LRRLTDGGKIGKIELQKNGLLARLVLQFGDCVVRFLGATRGEVYLRVVRQQLLMYVEPPEVG